MRSSFLRRLDLPRDGGRGVTSRLALSDPLLLLLLFCLARSRASMDPVLSGFQRALKLAACCAGWTANAFGKACPSRSPRTRCFFHTSATMSESALRLAHVCSPRARPGRCQRGCPAGRGRLPFPAKACFRSSRASRARARPDRCQRGYRRGDRPLFSAKACC
jgi:hypothetical protein